MLRQRWTLAWRNSPKSRPHRDAPNVRATFAPDDFPGSDAVDQGGVGGISRFALYDLSTDPNQQDNVAGWYPEVTRRLQEHVLAINADGRRDAADWGQSILVRQSR